MQFMVFMIPAGYQPSSFAKASEDSSRRGASGEQEFKPDPKRMIAMMSAMGKFNDEVKKATTVRVVDGLAPLAKGARLAFAGGKPTLTDGPAIQPKEVVGGFWLVDAKTKQQVVDLWKRCPAEDGDVIEIRPIGDLSDFPEEVQKALQQQGAGSKEQGPAVAKAMAGEAAKKAPESSTKGPFKKSRSKLSKDQD